MEKPEEFPEVNLAIYNLFVGLTPLFVRPPGSFANDLDKEGEVRLRSLLIKKLDAPELHFRINAVRSINACGDVYIRTVSEDEIQHLMDEVSSASGLDVAACEWFFALAQTDIYSPTGSGLSAMETQRIRENIKVVANDAGIQLGDFWLIAATQNRCNDFSDRPRMTPKGFDRVSADYNLVFAKLPA